MSSIQRTLEASAAIEAELNQEKASGLGRTGRALEAALDACRALAAEHAVAAEPRRSELLAEYQHQRAEAEKLLWFLGVQREALGVLNQEDLSAQYPMPPPEPGQT